MMLNGMLTSSLNSSAVSKARWFSSS
jgi:hypothetical protein